MWQQKVEFLLNLVSNKNLERINFNFHDFQKIHKILYILTNSDPLKTVIMIPYTIHVLVYLIHNFSN